MRLNRFCERFLFAALLAVTASTGTGAAQDYSAKIPEGINGPFISDTRLVEALDCGAVPGRCEGPLNFNKLIKEKANTAGQTETFDNPFKYKILKKPALEDLIKEIGRLRSESGAGDAQMSLGFLSDAGSRVELVGVINRMDRQFIKDTGSPLTERQRDCGEISLIYRFSYSILNGAQKSRLPITMNIVLPALPGNAEQTGLTCRDVATRWAQYMSAPNSEPDAQLEKLLDPATGVVSLLRGVDISRLELNMQVYRKPASSSRDFGTEAKYLIKVFQWTSNGYFASKKLTNQIDRETMLCRASESKKSCAAKEAKRQRLVSYLQDPRVVDAIDKGTLDIPEEFLAFSAVSISPGGVHRSLNQPFWKAQGAAEEIISDKEISRAISRYLADPKRRFSFISGPADFRTRLNDSTCSGCHQTRAIAGFHFPGADREQTPSANSVLLPGSPFFYGDQPRRAQIVKKMADDADNRLVQAELAIGFTARPLNKLAEFYKETQLLDGWGSSCIPQQFLGETKRTSWTCRAGLTCKQVFKSLSEPWVGICQPSSERQVGDALQAGNVVSRSYGKDAYERSEPPLKFAYGDERNSLIDVTTAFPTPGNSYYGAHQEYYGGPSHPVGKVAVRDQQTGGFPAGMLRLSECKNLPEEATCALIASTGFNNCINRIASGTYSLMTCFENFTSFAGMRACDAASPCRDDYICVKPMLTAPNAETNVAQTKAFFEARLQRLKSGPYFNEILGAYKPDNYFGQGEPDLAWAGRNDRRGVCIPPYFVFQFRSDMHPHPD